MRKIQFENGAYYHVYNRGVDKRKIFLDARDIKRFFQSMKEFNTPYAIGSIHERQFYRPKRSEKQKERLVDFVCYCCNPNHFHFILEQLIDKGIERFMHKLGSGYSTYFNKKYKRSGVLFQGAYKAKHIGSDIYLLHASAYVNLNNKIKGKKNPLSQSSWDEYVMANQESFCNKDVVLNQFGNTSKYKEFAENALQDIRKRKELAQELEL
ncbi:MAG: transposase [Candidatus Wildermuthbacteria bacterium]|nr:transposase [Candidatus Wildermuthbacteria bacterium]